MNGILKQIHPVLPVRNVNAAIAYYVEKLGFLLLFADDEQNPRYAGIGKDAIEIHLQWHDSREWEVTVDRPMLRIVTENIDALFVEYAGKEVFHEGTALKETPWGTREFAFYDPDKNGLTFYSDL